MEHSLSSAQCHALYEEYQAHADKAESEEARDAFTHAATLLHRRRLSHFQSRQPKATRDPLGLGTHREVRFMSSLP